MRLDFKLRCSSRAHFEAWMIAKGFASMETPKDSKEEVFTLNPDVQIAEIGQITQIPAVMKPGTFEVQTPAVIDTAYHVDVRIISTSGYQRDAYERQGKPVPKDLREDLYEAQTKDLPQTVEVAGVKQEASFFDRTAIGAEMELKTGRLAGVTNGVKRAAGYVDADAGVAIITPLTPRHIWC